MNSKSGKNIIVAIIGIIFQYLWQSQRTLTVRQCFSAVTIIIFIMMPGRWIHAQCPNFPIIMVQDQPIIHTDACYEGWETGVFYSPFRTLTCAVKPAQNGHIIEMESGIYREKNIKINKKLTIRASGGPVRIGENYEWGRRDISIGLAPNKAAEARVYFPKDIGQTAPDQIACGGPFPVVVYAHGRRFKSQIPCDWLDQNTKEDLTSTIFEDYKRAKGIMERLAKAGIIIISVDWNRYWMFKDELDNHAHKGIPEIIKKVIAYLEWETQTIQSWFKGNVDLRRLGLMGHSTGGAGVLVTAIQLRGLIKAVGVIAPTCPNKDASDPNVPDPPCFEGWNPPQNIPILVIHGTHEHHCQVGRFPKDVYCGATPPKHLIVITGANHFGYTDDICMEPDVDKPVDCASVPPDTLYKDWNGWDNPSMVGGLEMRAAQILQQRAAGNYLRAFFMHYLKVPNSAGYINYLIQKSGSCECSDTTKFLTGKDPHNPFADLRAMDVEVKMCSEQ